MRVRLLVCAAGLAAAVFAAAALVPQSAQASCASEIGRLMSRDTEKLTTRYNRITQQIERKGANPRLIREECRVARQLSPKLEDQLAALKQSGCLKDPKMGPMVADIVRGHQSDLEMARRTVARAECR